MTIISHELSVAEGKYRHVVRRIGVLCSIVGSDAGQLMR